MLKSHRGISSRFRDRPRLFRFLGLLPAAILDFFENLNTYSAVIFDALHDAFFRLSISSTVFAQYIMGQTDRQTDRAVTIAHPMLKAYSFGIGGLKTIDLIDLVDLDRFSRST